MSGICDGRVVIVTGAGNGIGRAHARMFAAEGAKVVVNDLGGPRDGSGSDAGAAQAVVDEIVAAGGTAVANTDNIATWDGAKNLVQQAIDTYGGLDTLVNNAGILRDKMLVNMSESEWDSVIAVHLKGTFGTMRHAAEYWRNESKEGRPREARVINTSSSSGVFGNAGQSNYGAAKAGIASMSIIAGIELARYGVTVNAICPTALTRMTEDLPHIGSVKEILGGNDPLNPEGISPLVVWLGSGLSGEITGRVFGVYNGSITVYEGWVNGPAAKSDDGWAPSELTEIVPDLVRRAAPNASTRGVRPTS